MLEVSPGVTCLILDSALVPRPRTAKLYILTLLGILGIHKANDKKLFDR